MYKSLQAGRAMAAVLVVLFHLGGSIASEKYFDISWISIPFSFGKCGVEFFFVLSGFIIFSAHKMDLFKPAKLGGYLKKRVLRIYPTYWVILFAVLTVAIAIPSLRNSIQLDANVLLKSLLLIPQDKNIVGGTGAPILIVAWSLQYEMLFYAFFAVLILSRFLSIAIAIGLVTTYIFLKINNISTLNYPLNFFVNDYIVIFIMGVAVSFAYENNLIKKLPYRTYLFFGAALFLFTSIAALTSKDIFVNWITLLYGLASCFIIVGLIHAEDLGVVIGKQRWIQLLGDSSYALYLIHFPLISLLCKLALLIKLPHLAYFGAALAYISIFCACIFSAILFHILIEKPISKYLKKRFIYLHATRVVPT